jgi:hypothetical protein
VVDTLITSKGATNSIMLNQLDATPQEVRVVSEFLDVFPKELSGITANCDIEFVIELVPNTAPIFKRHISDRGSQFVARFWEQLHASLRTHLIHSSAYHPQKDGQTEWVNQILEDMLRACVMEYSGSWDKNLQWAEFSYNNSYQESLKMAPFEALYGRQCHTPLNWIEPIEKAIFSPDIVVEAEATVRRIQENLKVAKVHQESYANKRRRPLQFEAGDHVYLKV